MNWKQKFPTQLGSMGHYVGLANVSPLVDTRAKAPKTPTIFRYFQLENSYVLTPVLLYTRQVPQISKLLL